MSKSAKHEPDSEGRVLPYLVAAAFVGASLYPLWTDQDSFPLSTYPMFSHGRHETELTVDHLVGHSADGSIESLPPQALGTDEVLQAKVSIRRAVRAGGAAQKKLCERTAQNVGSDPTYSHLIAVEVRRATYDSIRYYTEDAPPMSTRTFAKCDVKR